ncbi:hypothetical protein pb186bvf_015154 [Paramecium bursaria]
MLRFCVKYFFEEQKYIHEFLKSKNKAPLQNELIANIEKVRHLNTLIAFVDKSYKQNSILNQAQLEGIFIFIKDRATILLNDDDNLKYIKGFFLTLQLNQLENRQVYQKIIDKIIDKYQKFEDDHLITVMETIIYNKLNEKYQIPADKINLIYDHLAINILEQESDLNNEQIFSQLPKLTNLIEYSDKYDFTKLIKGILQQSYGIMYYLRDINTADDLFHLVFQTLPTISSLEGLQARNDIKEFKPQIQGLKKQLEEIVKKLEKMLLKHEFSSQNIDVIIKYTKKYLQQPPKYLPTEIIQLIGNIYFTLVNQSKQQDFKFLADYLSLVYFISKFRPIYLQDKDYTIIQQLVAKENQIMIVAKTFELIASTEAIHYEIHHKSSNQQPHSHSTLRDQTLGLLEKKILSLKENAINPQESLVVVFQSLVSLEQYKSTILQQLFEFFSYGKILARMKWVDILIKFLPSLSIYTKRTLNQFYTTNDPQDYSNITVLWEKLIGVLISKSNQIQSDKIPLIIYYVSLAAELHLPFIHDLFHKFRSKIEQGQYTPEDYANIFFGYAKTKYLNKDFYTFLIAQVIEKPVNITIAKGMLAGFLKCRVFNNKLFQKIEEFLMKNNIDEGLAIQYLNIIQIINGQIKLKDKLIEVLDKSKNAEFIASFCQAFLFIEQDQIILNKYLQFVQKNQKLYQQSAYYTSQLHSLYQKLRIIDQYPQNQLEVLSKTINANNLNLAKYHIQMRKFKNSSSLQEEIIGYLKQLQIKSDKPPYYFIDDIVDAKQQIQSIEQLIPYSIDYQRGKYCFEINGPLHYIEDEKKRYLDGLNQRKIQFLQKLGYTFIEIDFEEWNKNQIALKDKIQNLIKQ